LISEVMVERGNVRKVWLVMVIFNTESQRKYKQRQRESKRLS